MFRLSCLFLEDVVMAMSGVKFGSSSEIGNGHDLSEIIKPLQSYLSWNYPNSNIFTDASSVIECLEVLESFTGTALEPG